jgi:8-oxo-dGTP pyrophosphatase MutT (NUDIX family)
MGGAYVFPGGAVDASDRDTSDRAWVDGLELTQRRLPDLPPIDAAAHHVAGIRELFEEAGLLLARDRARQFVDLADPSVQERFARYRHDVHAGARTFRSVLEDEDLRAAADALTLFAHWVTPPIAESRRFDTRFFAVALPPNQLPNHDERETTDGRWVRPQQALDSAERGEIILPPPTWITLRELAEFASVGDILAWAATRDVRRREPVRADHPDTRVLMLPHADCAGRWGTGETPFAWVGDRWLPVKS